MAYSSANPQRGTDELEVNAWIAANLKNGRLNELNKKYFGDDLPELILKQ